MSLRTLFLLSSSLAGLSAAALAQSGAAPVVRLDEVVVEGAGEGVAGLISGNGYVTTSGRSGTKTDTPLVETPQSISTVTRTQIDQRQPQSLLEALSYTPGARIGAFGFDPRYDAFTIRGVDVTQNAVFRDGLRQIGSPNGLMRLEPYGLEGISVLRGPSASVYGASSAGGIVDLISKRPTQTPFREIELQAGSFGRLQGAFDLSGPANAEKTLLYRLTGLVRDAKTEVGAIRDDRVFIAPAFTWRPNGVTSLTLLGEYMDSTTGGTAAYVNRYAPFVDQQGNVLSKSIGATRVFGGDGRYNDFRQKQGRIGYEFEHEFSEMFTLRQKARYSHLSTDQEYVFGGSGLVREDTRGVSIDTSLEAKVATGPVLHRILAGFDVSHLSYRGKEGFDILPVGLDPALGFRTAQRQTLLGVYLQDQISLAGWRLTLGGRHDWFDSSFESGVASAAPTESRQNDRRFTGRAALSHVFDGGLAPYVAFGTSFVPNSGRVLDGSVAAPTKGEQIEVGVKYEPPGANLSLRAAVFDLEQKDGLVFEVVQGVNRQVQLDLRSRGVELEAVASLASGLSLQASYSYNDARILKLTPETEGNRLTSVPYHMASVWLDYTVPDGPARGLGFGGGLRFVGASAGDNLDRKVIANAPRTLLDASLRYDLEGLDPRLKGVRVQLSATNLLDRVEQTCTAGFCYFDEGRKVIASLRYRW
jgi:iron complex outermembrane receptor protein